MPAPLTDDFELYIQKRRARRRIVIGVLIAAFIGVVAIPYSLMHAGMMKQDTFEIFCVADFFIAAGLVRALVVRVTDQPSGML